MVLRCPQYGPLLLETAVRRLGQAVIPENADCCTPVTNARQVLCEYVLVKRTIRRTFHVAILGRTPLLLTFISHLSVRVCV